MWFERTAGHTNDLRGSNEDMVSQGVHVKLNQGRCTLVRGGGSLCNNPQNQEVVRDGTLWASI